MLEFQLVRRMSRFLQNNKPKSLRLIVCSPGARPDLVAFAAALTPADDQYLEFRQARIWSTRNDLIWSLIQLSAARICEGR